MHNNRRVHRCASGSMRAPTRPFPCNSATGNSLTVSDVIALRRKYQNFVANLLRLVRRVEELKPGENVKINLLFEGWTPAGPMDIKLFADSRMEENTTYFEVDEKYTMPIAHRSTMEILLQSFPVIEKKIQALLKVANLKMWEDTPSDSGYIYLDA